jgi:hypothetical protein
MGAIESPAGAMGEAIVAESRSGKSQMAGLEDVRTAALEVVGPICGHRPRSFSEADVGRILHAFLAGRHAAVWPQCPVAIGKSQWAIDFRFGDRPYGGNPCVVELAVRGTEHGQQLQASQNRNELTKLSRYPFSKARTRVLLLLDFGHAPLEQTSLQPAYDGLRHLGAGKFQRRSISVLYVHRDSNYRFIWRP